MPIYEYRCTSCSAEMEKLRKISDPPLVQCPECGKDTLVKLVSASSFRLKGSGWYETDFKTGKKKNGVGDADSSGSSTTPDSAKKAGGAKDSADGGKDGGAANKAAATESKPPGASATTAPKQ
jgi:putative FmdB family regulatory protein